MTDTDAAGATGLVINGEATVRVTATGPDALRIEIRRAADPVPERASWAVLPEWWEREIAGAGDGRVRFATTALAVTADPCLAVHDRAGRELLAFHRHEPIAIDASGLRLRLHAQAGTEYFGLGDKPDHLAKRGHAYALWNTDAYGFGESWDPLYKSIPFLLGVAADGTAWGLLVDDTRRLGFDLAGANADALLIATPATHLRLHLLAGPTPKDVLRGFAALVGRAPLPPLWSLGYGQCRYSYESGAAALAVAQSHRERDIPLDAVWLDIGFQDRNRPYTTDPERFGDLAGTVAALGALSVRTVVIADLHVPVLPGGGYAPYDTGIAGDHFVKDANGETYVGAVWPGPCHFPDFTRVGTRDWWGGLAARFVADGVSGFWNDMNEPAVFKTAGHTMPSDLAHRVDEPGFRRRVATHDEIHNVYGMQNARATYDGLRRLAPDRRPFVLTRASYAGGHRYAATWTGDNTSAWNHLKLSTPQLLGLGLCGFGLAGCDIGGFKGSPSPDLLTQWIAVGAFNPLFRNHTDLDTRKQEATEHGPEHEALRRRAIENRYRLLPYLYTVVEEWTRTGVPPMRPLFLEFPDDAAVRRDDRAFMLGDALLVAPPPDETLDDYALTLPRGADWFDHWSGRAIDADADNRIMLPRRLGHVPVLARAGSIVPQAKLARNVDARGGALRLHVYPGADRAAHGTVYDDDGASFAFAEGAFCRQSFRFDGTTLVLDEPEGTRAPYWDAVRVTVHGVDADASAHDAGGMLPSSHDRHAGTIRFRLDRRVGRVSIGRAGVA